jgi:surfactin synthase thioesterase subunit
VNRAGTPDHGWLRALTSPISPVVRLVCFPHSGGSATTYRTWSAALPAGVQLLAVQYPGHTDRTGEAAIGSITEMGTAVAAALTQLEPTRCALFGHSLGALVAYETAKSLQDNGLSVHLLFVSGSQPPWRVGGGRMHHATDDELWSALRELGGIAPEVADDAELRDLLLPGLRSDIALNETYQPARPAHPLRCQVRCYYNTDDPLVDGAQLAEWATVGQGRFSMRVWPGGHLQFLSDSTELITDIIESLQGEDVAR